MDMSGYKIMFFQHIVMKSAHIATYAIWMLFLAFICNFYYYFLLYIHIYEQLTVIQLVYTVYIALSPV